MFVLTEIEDIIEIRVSTPDRKQAIIDKLQQKYSNKVVGDLGISLFVTNIIEILEYEIQSEMLLVSVVFEMVFYRFYRDEIIFGKVKRQEEEKIIVVDKMLFEYTVNACDLFDNCEFEADEGNSTWIWNYKDNKLPFTSDGQVRLRIKTYKIEENICEALMNEQGLGPLCWWD